MHTLALWVEPTRYRDFIPVLYEIECRCKAYDIDFEQEVRHFISLISKYPAYHHPKFNMSRLADELMEFIGHLHSRGDSLENWYKLHNLLYYTPNRVMFRRGGEADNSSTLQGIELSMQYLELYAKI